MKPNTAKKIPSKSADSIRVLVPPLLESRVKEQEFAYTVHVADIGASVPKENIWKPEYWVNCAKRFREMDRLEIRYEDQSYWAEALILSADRSGARLYKLREVNFDDEQIKGSNEYSSVDAGLYLVEYKGRRQRWVVIRKSDGVVCKEGLTQRLQALQVATQLNVGEE